MPFLPRKKRRKYHPTQRKRKPTSDQQFYNTRRWRKTSLLHKMNNPLCEACCSVGQTAMVEVTDHIIPITQGGHHLDERNLMSLCHDCHNRKSGMEAHGYMAEARQIDGGLVPIRRGEVVERLRGNGIQSTRENL